MLKFEKYAQIEENKQISDFIPKNSKIEVDHS